MASWFTKDHPSAHQAEAQSLTDILTASQRTELPLLVAKIAEVMRKRTESTFDASITKPTPQQVLKDKKTLNPEPSKPQKETDEEEHARKLAERRAKELSAPKMRELKNAVLEYFDKWEKTVLGRVEEVIKPTASPTKPPLSEEVKAEAAAHEADTAASTTTKAVTQDNKPSSASADSTTTNVEDSDAALIDVYPPVSTSLLSLPREQRTLLLHSMLLLLLSLEHYTSYSRILLLYLSSSLHLPLHVLTELEVKVAQGLVAGAKQQMSGEEEAKHREDQGASSRRWKVGLAGVAGAALIGVTGGLAAPLVAAGVASIMGGVGLGATAAAGLLGTLAESGVVVGALFGAYGGRMTSRMMDQYAQEVHDFAFLPLHGSFPSSSSSSSSKKPTPFHSKESGKPEDRRLRITIGISGWLTTAEDVMDPWRALSPTSSSTEIFALRWELEALLRLGTSLETFVKSYAWSVAKKEIIARTIFATFFEALWPLGLLRVSKVVDNPFSVAKNRADKAGLVLADALINRAQGERPVTLVGYSLGARVIYSCLMSLAERRAFGLVESVVLMGAPAPSDSPDWRAMRSVVAGRLVNVYSTNDYVLAFLYRTSAVQFGVAGIQEIQDVKGVENVDVSGVVEGHLRYRYLVGSILGRIGWEGIDVAEVQQEEETVSLLEEDEKRAEKDGDGEGKTEDAEQLEKKVEQTMAQRWMAQATEGMRQATEMLHLK